MKLDERSYGLKILAKCRHETDADDIADEDTGARVQDHVGRAEAAPVMVVQQWAHRKVLALAVVPRL